MHRIFYVFLPAVFFAFTLTAFGQETKPSEPPVVDDEDIVKITTTLIQIDVVVTDKDGKQITDLKPEDFQIFQDGKLQTITNFSYVNSETSQRTTLISSKNKTNKKQPAAPPSGIRSKQGRIITFVIDDGNCLATFEGTSNIRDGVKKFINEQMLPDDKVAIYRTRGGTSLLQMYTSNKEVLKRIVDKVNWLPSACGSAFEPLRDKSTFSINRGGEGNSRQGAETFESEADKEFRKDNENRERDNQVIGTVGVLNFVVDRLKNVPQRKIVFLISEGIMTRFDSGAYEALRELADKASRASVVINTVSAKGVTVPGFLAAQDEVLPGILGGTDNTLQASQDRVDEERALNEGLSYLAYTTGGKFLRNRNFLETGIKEVLDTEKGYYLIGYEPEDETFKGKNFHRIQVKLNRPGLKVSSRKGFYGRTDTESQVRYKNADSPMYQAIASPFQENGMDIRMTTLAGNDSSGGNYIRALVHIKGKDLTFTDEPDGTKKVVLDVVLITLDEKGRVTDEFNRTYPIRIPKQGVEIVLQNGLDYSTDMPVKKPGIYSVRLAVRDEKSKRLGSAGDFIEIPDMKKDRFFMSGLVATNLDEGGKANAPKKRPVEAGFAPVFSGSIASIRQYKGNETLAYTYNIYNAKPDGATGQPKLTRQVRLYKNGNLLAEGKETPVEIKEQKDLSRIRDEGIIRINPNNESGEYILQIIVRDLVANKIVSQWIDFEVIQ